MSNSSRIHSILMAITLATTVVACEDLPSPAPRTSPSSVVSAEPPKPTELPTPPPVALLPPGPNLAAESGSEKQPVADDDGTTGPLDGARQRLSAGDAEGALKLAKVAVLHTPKRSGAWNTLGRAQLQMGKRQEAIASFEKAVELNPRSSFAHNNLGLALIYDRRFEQAVDALEQAVELEPVEGYMWNNLGMAYEQLDRLEEARDAYGKAVEMESDHARDSLARLTGVESVVRTARVEAEPGGVQGTKDGSDRKAETTVRN
jgi:predicted negative regulator of RcsB-dependent stress response